MPAALLAVFAHPDDEALRCGGTLARAAAQGVHVTLACLTRGEAGRNTDPSLGDVNLPAAREQELRDACVHLGIQPPRFLDYHDSGRGERLRTADPLACINADPVAVEDRILEVIAQVRPQVMVTFDPHGIYGHPDHLVAHRAATGAFARSAAVGRPVERLYYVAQLHEDMRALQGERPLGVLQGLDPDVYAVDPGLIAAQVDVRDYAAHKLRALRAHRTQTGPLSTLGQLSDTQLTPLLRRETFSLGGTRTPLPHHPLTDLFDGVTQGLPT